MARHLSDPFLEHRWTHIANDRLKARWSSRVGASIALAVVLHGAAFAFWPAWERSRSELDPLENFLQLEWVAVLETRAPPSEEPAPAIQIGAIPDSIPSEGEVFASRSGTGEEIATVAEAFRERLLGRSAPRPTLSEPEAVSESGEGTEPGTSENIEVNRGLSEVDFSELLGSEPLDLDRLSAVRPELVLAAPSAWVLLRNPTEVERFLIGTYRRGDLPRSANGSVSVALWINERGSVEWAEISESSGRSDMDRVALELFSEVAAFRPARDQGVAVPRSVIFSLRFPWY